MKGRKELIIQKGRSNEFKKLIYGGAYKGIQNDCIKQKVIIYRIKIILLFPIKFIIFYIISLNLIAINGIFYLFAKENMDYFDEAIEVVNFKAIKKFFEYFYNHTYFEIKCKNCGNVGHYSWDERDTFGGEEEKDFCIKWCGSCKFKQGEQNENS